MAPTPILQLVLAFGVLALAIFAFGDGESPAWWWTTLVGAALAAVVGADGWSERKRATGGPVSAKVTAFVATRLVLPILTILAAAAAWGTGETLWRDVAAVLAVALAVSALL